MPRKISTDISRMNDTELQDISKIQTHLAATLVKQAAELNIKAKDWIQGGWSRSKANITDKVEIGITPERQ